MAASAMTPKLLGRISNEEYQEKDNWEIDDIALGPANELLISGHNLEIPETFISMHKEDSGKYGNRPEFNRSFRQPQPSEQLVLFLEGSSIIGLKVESALRLVSIRGIGFMKTLNWKWSPTCVCSYKGKLYAASSSSTIVSVCNLDSEDKSRIILSDMRNDCVLDMVVVMEKIYVCTKDAGRALVFSMTGSKEMEFEYAFETYAMATSICIHERTELVFVLWNDIQIQLYSQKTSQCLRAFDMTEDLHKIRVTTDHILVTLSASKCIVSVYDMGEAIKFGEFENTLLSSVKKKHRKKLMSNDEENVESHPAAFESLSIQWKSAPKQSKVENLRDMKELYIQQLKENDNRRIKDERDIQKLRSTNMILEKQAQETEEKLQLQERKTEEAVDRFGTMQSDLKEVRNENEVLRGKVVNMETEILSIKQEFNLEMKTLYKLRSKNMILEKQVQETEAKLQLQERKTEEAVERFGTMQSDLKEVRNENEVLREKVVNMETENLSEKQEFNSQMQTLNELKHDIDRSKKEKGGVTEELENTRSNLSSKEADLSDVQAKLDAARTESDDLRRTNEEKEEKCCSLTKQLVAERKTTEELKHDIDRSEKEKDDVKEELENTRSNLSSKEADLSDVQAKLDAVSYFEGNI